MKQEPGKLKSLFGAIAAGWLEYYDFSLFAYFINEIGESFLPDSDLQNTFTWALWGMAFVIRPLSGIWFGYLGDTVGRVAAMRISILMMAVPTLIVGLCPTYSQIGYFATFILFISRMIQGIAVGGASPGALVYLCEVSPPNLKTMAAASIEIPGGALLACLASSITKHYKFSWRWPFLLGIIIIYFGHRLKEVLQKSPEHAEIQQIQEDSGNKKLSLMASMSRLKCSWKQIFFTMSVMSTGFFRWYMLFVWHPWYLENRDINPMENANSGTTVCMFIYSFILVFCGWLTSKLGPEVCMNYGLTFSIIITPYFYSSFETCEGSSCWLLQTFYGVFLALYSAPVCSWQVDMMPFPQIRFIAIAFMRNTCGILAGACPSVATFLLRKYSIHEVAYASMFLDVFALLALWSFPKELKDRNEADTDEEEYFIERERGDPIQNENY